MTSDIAHVLMAVVDPVLTSSLQAPGALVTHLTGLRDTGTSAFSRPTIPAASPMSGPRELTSGARFRDPLYTDSGACCDATLHMSWGSSLEL